MSTTNSSKPRSDGAAVHHWYDFICPFCYIAQDRNALLREQGTWIGTTQPHSLQEFSEQVTRSQHDADLRGVSGTPTWIVGDEQITGLRSREWFKDWAGLLRSMYGAADRPRPAGSPHVRARP